MGVEVEVTNELTSHSDLVLRNQPQFAALLVKELFNEDTKVKSNARGRGKEKLDPTIIEFMQCELYYSALHSIFIYKSSSS